MAVGYTFPFQITSGSVGYFQMTNTELDAIKSNLRVLLLTNWGERPMHSDFGCNLREFLFEQSAIDDLASRIADRILQQVAKWMPFVALTNLNVLFSTDDPSIRENEMVIKMAFKLISRPNTIETFELTVAQ